MNARPLSWLAAIVIAGCGGSTDGAVHDLAGADLAGADLAGADLAGADLASPPLPDEPTSLSGITSAHNAVRQGASPTPTPALDPLAWSSSLAADAQAWASGCLFKHSGNGHGENIFASAGSTPTGAGVVGSWADEASNYDYAGNSCAGTCGHYTQIVWRQSARLGCALESCTQNSPFPGFSSWSFVVCDYDPPGNSGGRPY